MACTDFLHDMQSPALSPCTRTRAHTHTHTHAHSHTHKHTHTHARAPPLPGLLGKPPHGPQAVVVVEGFLQQLLDSCAGQQGAWSGLQAGGSGTLVVQWFIGANQWRLWLSVAMFLYNFVLCVFVSVPLRLHKSCNVSWGPETWKLMHYL